LATYPTRVKDRENFVKLIVCPSEVFWSYRNLVFSKIGWFASITN
jgi:hypothetical protein